MGRAKRQVTLEEYVNFHENPQHPNLTIKCLLQIIRMHGFIKLHNRPKKDILDALNSIDMLIPPLRSTLNENISSNAYLSLDQVNKDLAALEWQECPVQSVATMEWVEENQLASDQDHLQIICGQPATRNALAASTPVRKLRSKRRKRNFVKTETGVSTSAAAVFDDDSAPLPSSWLSLGFF
ncbi:uncharacterized protein LOC131230290 [Magnolia sinica]|uniref:uncharacterized protein LOC131230290 n=1 Tax=Magnolia sinica TaxID=86752 RepID=UPI00265B226C|nr:uncharacterized protein LOC131230290 [Magnolia sinica]